MASTENGNTQRRRSATVVAQPRILKRTYAPGETIADKYVLQELLGEGGMGAVWRAHNTTLDIDVAVKLIRAEEAQAPDGAELGHRLLQEARAAAQLGHPAITRVFDFGASDRGDPFIVMELLEGEDLAQALARRGRIVATKAVALLLPIVHALAAAHAKGIVHRDIKPENIFLSRAEDGRTQPKLVDFGIAKMERGKAAHRLTQTGAMLGSPIYMSPEQARGDDVDHLADVWAVCVVLFEMVTGRPPFEGKNYNALLYSIIADEPPPITAFGAGDEELWALLRRGFEKDPDRRWPSVREFGTALAYWMLARNVHEDVTGGSLSAQWIRVRSNSGDAFASVSPPLPWSGPVRVGPSGLDGSITERRQPEGGDFPFSSLRTRIALLVRKRRLAAWSLGAVLASGVALLLWGLLGTQGPVMQAEPLPAPLDEPLPDFTVVTPSSPLTAPPEAPVRKKTQVAEGPVRAASEQKPPRSDGTVKGKSPIRRPQGKQQLKNPFEPRPSR